MCRLVFTSRYKLGLGLGSHLNAHGKQARTLLEQFRVLILVILHVRHCSNKGVLITFRRAGYLPPQGPMSDSYIYETSSPLNTHTWTKEANKTCQPYSGRDFVAVLPVGLGVVWGGGGLDPRLGWGCSSASGSFHWVAGQLISGAGLAGFFL